MPNYRRAHQPGGTFFLTLVTQDRRPIFHDPGARRFLHAALAIVRKKRPIDLIASVLLPEHLHLVLALPPGDADFSTRVAACKARFARQWLTAGRSEAAQSSGRTRQGYRGVWQRRFWEHFVRDEDDLIGCCDYVHYNPVKHGHVECPHAWPWSSFHRHVRDGNAPASWQCRCEGAPGRPPPPDVRGAEGDV